MKQQLLQILGVCYVCFALYMATGSTSSSFDRPRDIQGVQDSLERENYRGNGYSQRLPGPQRTPEAERQFGWRPEYLPTGEAHANTETAETEVGEAVITKSNCLVLWAADWCPACKKMYPIVKKLKAEGYNVYIMDYDENREVAKELGIDRLPTTLIFRDGAVVARHVGVTSAETIKKDLKKNSNPSESRYVT